MSLTARAAAVSDAISAMIVTVLPAPSASHSAPPRSGELIAAFACSCQPTDGSCASEKSRSSKSTSASSICCSHRSTCSCRAYSLSSLLHTATGGCFACDSPTLDLIGKSSSQPSSSRVPTCHSIDSFDLWLSSRQRKRSSFSAAWCAATGTSGRTSTESFASRTSHIGDRLFMSRSYSFDFAGS